MLFIFLNTLLIIFVTFSFCFCSCRGFCHRTESDFFIFDIIFSLLVIIFGQGILYTDIELNLFTQRKCQLTDQRSSEREGIICKTHSKHEHFDERSLI